MAAALTRCDVVRDARAAVACGLCEARTCAADADCRPGQACVTGACRGRPAGCPAGAPAEVCTAPTTANKRLLLYASRRDPRRLFERGAARLARQGAEAAYSAGIAAAEARLAAAYGGAPPEAVAVGWEHVDGCLVDPSGAPATRTLPAADGRPVAVTRRYLDRADAALMGMQAAPALGGTTATGSLWRWPRVSPLPLAADYLANPDLFALVLLAMLLAALLAAVLIARRRAAAQNGGVAGAYRGSGSGAPS